MIVSSRKQFIKDVIPQKTLRGKDVALLMPGRLRPTVLISPGGSNVLLKKRNFCRDFKRLCQIPPYPPLEKVGISGTFLMRTDLSRVKAKFSEKKLDI
jgi:hypothetical protein